MTKGDRRRLRKAADTATATAVAQGEMMRAAGDVVATGSFYLLSEVDATLRAE